MELHLPYLHRAPLVAMVALRGAIGGRGLTDAGLAPVLARAFARGRPAAVALIINSPGGSPVQSSLIAARIRRLAAEKSVKVHAFVEDVAASGGYWLAAAADDIHADRSSILGSIGVISAGFGLQELIARHGVERRVHTAGGSKSQLDPFRPEDPADVARLEGLLETIHGHFIDHVRARRGARLADDPRLFTGEFWLGDEALRLGLADGIGHAAPVLKEIYGAGVRLRAYGPRRGLLSRIGADLAAEALSAVEERALWARYGM